MNLRRTVVTSLLVLLPLVLLLQPCLAVFIHKGPKDAYNKYEQGDTTVIDNFGSKALLAKLSDPEVWVPCDEKGKMWMDWGTKPKNIWQALNVLIFKDHPEVKTAKASNRSFVGFEYYCNITSNKSPLEGTHWQVIIDDANETHPHMGAVYFGFPHTVQGGMMDILPTQDRFKLDMDEPFRAKHYSLQFAKFQDKVQHVEPEVNRLVVFNSSFWHGVHRITQGSRFQFVTNLWTSHPKDAPPPPTPEELRQMVRAKRIKKLTKAYQNYQPGDTTIIDEFGEDSLKEKLNDEKAWEECSKKKEKRWMDWDAQPKNAWEMTSKLIYQRHPEVVALAASKNETPAGYEYWCTQMDEYGHRREEEEGGIPFQVQTDEVQKSFPLMGAHYYGYEHKYHREIEGGKLRILTPKEEDTVLLSTEQAAAYAQKHKKAIEEVDPLYNRVVIFNATKWHEISAVEQGDYYALMVNLWKEKPKTWKDLKISSYSYADSDDDTPQHDEF